MYMSWFRTSAVRAFFLSISSLCGCRTVSSMEEDKSIQLFRFVLESIVDEVEGIVKVDPRPHRDDVDVWNTMSQNLETPGATVQSRRRVVRELGLAETNVSKDFECGRGALTPVESQSPRSSFCQNVDRYWSVV